VSTHPKTFLTPEQYLEIERKAEYKSEYYAGEMFAMAGARESHNLIAMHAGALLDVQFRGRPCRVYGSDMRVRVSRTGLYTYPDVSAVCGEPQLEDDELDTLLNPVLIIEVLSPSTEAYDRGRKFEQYRTIPSLMQYVLIASERVYVDVYTRDREGRWILTSAWKPEDVVQLTSAECSMRIADVYDKTGLIEAKAGDTDE
jgi:Uma2 family endonuclease